MLLHFRLVALNKADSFRFADKYTEAFSSFLWVHGLIPHKMCNVN